MSRERVAVNAANAASVVSAASAEARSANAGPRLGIDKAKRILRALLVATPTALALAWLTATSEPSNLGWGVLGASVGLSFLVVLWNDGVLVRRLRTVSSVLAAYRDGDFSIRARSDAAGGPLDSVLSELSELGDTLREHRLGELEAWTLLRKVLAEVDVVVVAISDAGRVRLANDAAVRVLGKSAPEMLTTDARSLGIDDLLVGDAPRVIQDSPRLGGGQWELRRGTFRLSGEPHTLLVLSDVGAALRHQERDAWKRLIRVMGHEINNSLAPIQSISENLQTVLRRAPREGDWEEDMESGLSVIARRSEALARFMSAYAQLARLPAPRLQSIDVPAWVSRTAALEQRLRIDVAAGLDVTIMGDADQLDQLLINLFKNAVDAALETHGGVRVGWSVTSKRLLLTIEDDGPGVADTKNLFVPFFTTKPGGSGIGLVLARQIAEAHGGRINLRSCAGAAGAEAIVDLPIG